MGEPGPDALRAKLNAEVDRYFAMEQDDFLAVCVALATDSGLEFDEQLTMRQIMLLLARMGSTEAVAAMVVMGAPHEDILEALQALAGRNPEIMQGIVTEQLVEMFEEFADAEVKAGRMTVTIDPATGHKLYGSEK